jgi:hypothetical protein
VADAPISMQLASRLKFDARLFRSPTPLAPLHHFSVKAGFLSIYGCLVLFKNFSLHFTAWRR